MVAVNSLIYIYGGTVGMNRVFTFWQYILHLIFLIPSLHLLTVFFKGGTVLSDFWSYEPLSKVWALVSPSSDLSYTGTQYPGARYLVSPWVAGGVFYFYGGTNSMYFHFSHDIPGENITTDRLG